MARVAVGLGVRELAEAAKVSPDTVARFERGDELKARTVDAIRAALEAAGVIFVEENGDGPGVRLRKPYEPGDYSRAAEAGSVSVSVGREPSGQISTELSVTPRGKKR